MHDNSGDYDSEYDQFLINRLEHNYNHLHSEYRLGNSDRKIGYLRKLNTNQNGEGLEFLELCAVSQSAKAGKLKFGDAINDLYRLVEYIEHQRNDLAAVHGVLLLRCKCVIYEATDYFLRVPKELGSYFVDLADSLTEHKEELETFSEKLNGGPFSNKDERAKVIKLQLIAAIWGANELYRAHNSHSYNRAFAILEKVNRIICQTLPLQHEQPRECFGILGLSQYLTGRVLFRKNLVVESQRAFRKSADAYHARLRQKEEFHAKKLISPELFEEKVSVTIRRTALVTAFGDGYHHFVSGQLTRALESLTLARAALTRNSGKVYLIYVDMLYWACRRARESSDPATVELCIAALRDCRIRFDELIPNSHYFHRAGIQIARALFCRMRLTGDVAGHDYDEGCKYLDDAIEYAESVTPSKRYRNPSLLAAALITRSRYLRYGIDAGAKDHQRRYDELVRAREAAQKAHLVSDGIKLMQTEASTALGEVHTDLAALNRIWHKSEFGNSFDAALGFFQRAITENNRQNLRNHAVCLLGLTRLCLLNPNTEVAAREYFAEWKTIAELVEHSDCQIMAKQLEPQFSAPVLMISLSERLEVKKWEERLKENLLESALDRFWTKDRLDRPSKKWRWLLSRHLQVELGYKSAKVNTLIRERGLLERVTTMRSTPLKSHPVPPLTRSKKPST